MLITPDVKSRVNLQQGAEAVTGDKLESNSIKLNETVSSSRMSEEDINITTLDFKCKQEISGELIEIQNSTDERKPNSGTMDVSFKYIRSLSNKLEINNIHTGKRPANKKYVCCHCEKCFSTPSKLNEIVSSRKFEKSMFVANSERIGGLF